ncbi:MAG: hypothetical protein NVSMB51_18130 [Solirubrobacteraceae bacterium]
MSEEDKKHAEEMRKFEEQDELPSDLKEWPDGKAKFVTFGEDDDAPYGEGKTAKLGPPVTHHEDGSVSVDGKKVDDPDKYKGEPIKLAVEGMDIPNPQA